MLMHLLQQQMGFSPFALQLMQVAYTRSTPTAAAAPANKITSIVSVVPIQIEYKLKQQKPTTVLV